MLFFHHILKTNTAPPNSIFIGPVHFKHPPPLQVMLNSSKWKGERKKKLDEIFTSPASILRIENGSEIGDLLLAVRTQSEATQSASRITHTTTPPAVKPTKALISTSQSDKHVLNCMSLSRTNVRVLKICQSCTAISSRCHLSFGG